MERQSLINHLINARGYARYLEIGVEDPDSLLNKVALPDAQKVGVDPQPLLKRNTNIHVKSSDDFFAQNNDLFDIIFVDGLHTYEQAYKDIINALEYLSVGGVVLVHDAYPKDCAAGTGEWLQRPYSQYKYPQAWQGQVWRAVWRAFSETGYEVATLDADWGIACIDTTRKRNGRKVRFKKFDESGGYDFLQENVKNVLRPMDVKEFAEWLSAKEDAEEPKAKLKNEGN